MMHKKGWAGLFANMLLTIWLLTSCGNPPKPFSSESTISTADVAEITEIPNRTVWIRFLSSNSDSIAGLGRTIKAGETIRTEKNALAQIALRSGAILRMEGNTTLSIDGNQKIWLKSGKIMVWAPSQNPTKIMLAQVTATAKNAFVYIESGKTLRLICLEGKIEIAPDARNKSGTNKSSKSTLTKKSSPKSKFTKIKFPKLIVLKSGQSLEIEPKNPAKIIALTPQTLKSQLETTQLLSAFNSKIGNSKIDGSKIEGVAIAAPSSAKTANIPAKTPRNSSRQSESQPYFSELRRYSRRQNPDSVKPDSGKLVRDKPVPAKQSPDKQDEPFIPSVEEKYAADKNIDKNIDKNAVDRNVERKNPQKIIDAPPQPVQPDEP